MSANTTAVIILQYTNVSNQCLAHLKLAQCHSQLYLNKTKRKKKKNQIVWKLRGHRLGQCHPSLPVSSLSSRGGMKGRLSSDWEVEK